MSKVMSWSTNWPTKVNPDVRRGLGFSLKASLSSFLARGTAGVGDGLFLHGRTQAIEQRILEAGSGGWLLNMKPKRPSVVGLWMTRSMPRNSAPWGGVGGSSAAAAGAIQAALTAVPSEVAPTAVPSETAAVPFRKLRRLKSSARFSPIAFPPISSRPGGAKRDDHVCPDKALYAAGWILSTREL